MPRIPYLRSLMVVAVLLATFAPGAAATSATGPLERLLPGRVGATELVHRDDLDARRPRCGSDGAGALGSWCGVQDAQTAGTPPNAAARPALMVRAVRLRTPRSWGVMRAALRSVTGAAGTETIVRGRDALLLAPAADLAYAAALSDRRTLVVAVAENQPGRQRGVRRARAALAAALAAPGVGRGPRVRVRSPAGATGSAGAETPARSAAELCSLPSGVQLEAPPCPDGPPRWSTSPGIRERCVGSGFFRTCNDLRDCAANGGRILTLTCPRRDVCTGPGDVGGTIVFEGLRTGDPDDGLGRGATGSLVCGERETVRWFTTRYVSVPCPEGQDRVDRVLKDVSLGSGQGFWRSSSALLWDQVRVGKYNASYHNWGVENHEMREWTGCARE